MNDEPKLAEMSLALDRPSQPKVFCKAKVRSERTGYVVANCSMHRGHVGQDGQPNDHVDVHEAIRWANAMTPGDLAPVDAN